MSESYPPPPANSPYPQPEYPPGGTPVAAGPPLAAVPPPKKSKTGRIILIAVAAVVLLCLGGAAVIYFTIGDEVAETIEATQTRVVAPDTLGGKPKVEDQQLQLVADQVVSEIETEFPEATSTVSGFYGDPVAEDLVMIVAVSVVLLDPAQEVDDALTEFGANNVFDVDPGPLGGEAQCGDAQDGDLQMGVCAWADRGSLGMIVVYFDTGQAAAANLVAYRSEIQQQS